MTEPLHEPTSRDERLNQAIAEYLELNRHGKPIDRVKFLAQYPDLAADLGSFFDNHDRIAQLGAPLQQANRAWMDQATVQPASTRIEGGANQAAAPTYQEASPDSLDRHFGNYELVREIARGGMGVVYLARQPKLDRMVAVKMILAGPYASRSDVERFHTEAQAAAALRHPNIVAIHEVGEQDGQSFFSMDYIDGSSLAGLLAGGPLAADRAARHVSIIADAIHYAHTCGILHRDLKPSNVVIDGKDQPHVTDFGLAKRIEGNSDLTGTGQALGTPSYMAPEQAVGRRGQVGPHSDIYSLGAILYELICGRPPFRANSPLDTLLQVLESEPVRPRAINPAVPLDLETICLKCLEKEPQRRYQTAAELAQDLRRFLNRDPIQARPITPIGRAWRWCLRHPGSAGLAAGLFFVLLGGLFALQTQRSLAQQAADQAKRLRQVSEMAIEDETFHYQLENGLTVLIRPIDGAKRVALVMLFSTGSTHDPEGQSGLAHLIEHLYVTAAAGDIPARTVAEYLQRYPAGWNAQTGDDYTVIAGEFEADQLGDELAEAAGRMSSLRITAADIEREKPRIRDELRNMYAAIPSLAARNAVRQMVRPLPHGGQRGGVVQEIDQLSSASLQARWQRYYKPQNAILAIAGKVEAATVRQAIDKHFATIPPGDRLPRPRPTSKHQLGQTSRQTVTPIQSGMLSEVCLGFAVPEPSDPLFAPFLVLVARLQTSANRFQPATRDPSDFPIIFAPLDDPGILYVRSTVRPGDSPDQTIARLEALVAELTGRDFHALDLAIATNTFSFLYGTAPVPDMMMMQNIYGSAFRIGRRAQLGVRGSALRDAIKAVDASSLREAQSLFGPARRATAVIQVKE